jgi:hypothetical protein
MPLYTGWLADVSFINYAFEALVAIEFSDPDIVYVFKAALPVAKLPPLVCHGDYVLKEFGFDEVNIYTDVVGLIAICLLFGLVVYNGLRCTHKAPSHP